MLSQLHLVLNSQVWFLLRWIVHENFGCRIGGTLSIDMTVCILYGIDDFIALILEIIIFGIVFSSAFRMKLSIVVPHLLLDQQLLVLRLDHILISPC